MEPVSRNAVCARAPSGAPSSSPVHAIAMRIRPFMLLILALTGTRVLSMDGQSARRTRNSRHDALHGSSRYNRRQKDLHGACDSPIIGGFTPTRSVGANRKISDFLDLADRGGSRGARWRLDCLVRVGAPCPPAAPGPPAP